MPASSSCQLSGISIRTCIDLSMLSSFTRSDVVLAYSCTNKSQASWRSGNAVLLVLTTVMKVFGSNPWFTPRVNKLSRGLYKPEVRLNCDSKSSIFAGQNPRLRLQLNRGSSHVQPYCAPLSVFRIHISVLRRYMIPLSPRIFSASSRHLPDGIVLPPPTLVVPFPFPDVAAAPVPCQVPSACPP